MSGDVEKTPEVVTNITELRRMSRVSNSSFLRSFSLNSTADSSLKRKVPDDDDSFLSASKKDSRLGSPLMSPWEFRRVRADLVDAQTQIVRLEDRIDQLHKKNKECVILFDQEKTDMKTQLENKSKTIEMLERKITKLRSSDTERQADSYDIKRNFEKKILDQQTKIQELTHTKTQLRLELAEVEEHADRTELELKTEIEKLKLELVRLKSLEEESEEQVSSAQAKLAVALEDCKDYDLLQVQLQKANDRVKELEQQRVEVDESRAVATVLLASQRMLKMDELEAELKQRDEEIAVLRATVGNKIMMEEKMHNMQIKINALADREKDYISLKEKNFDLETELERWCAMAENCCEHNSRDELQKYITELQQEQMQASIDKNELSSQLADVNFQLQAAQDEANAAQNTSKQYKELLDKVRAEVHILRRKIALVTRERDSYRQQLDMFEKDLTLSHNTGSAGSQERLQELEALLQSYREEMERLEKQLSQYRLDDVDGRIEGTRNLESALAASKAECERLSARRDELEKMLEERLQRGSYLSPNTKVLHFRNNPLAAAEEQQAVDVAELRKDCDRLRARVRLLEAGEKLDLTVRSAADVESGTAARVRELEEELESIKLKNTRLKEVFKRTSQDFRDVSYMLLGYRIDLVSNKMYKLTNMYSEDPDDHFMFQLNRSGMMEMLETEYTERVAGLVREHLLKNNSIPCFLSAVTLRLHLPEEESPAASQQSGCEEDEEEDDDEPDNGNDSDNPIEIESD